MGWLETCPVDVRMRFVMAAEERDEAFAATCRRFGVSRRVGYKWLARYHEAGVEGLVDLGVMPYYLHQLDRVAGASHFDVPESTGRRLMEELRSRLPGYAVPRYVREVAGETSKRPIELVPDERAG